MSLSLKVKKYFISRKTTLFNNIKKIHPIMNRFISLVKAIVFVLLIILLVDCARKKAGEFFIQIKGGKL